MAPFELDAALGKLNKAVLRATCARRGISPQSRNALDSNVTNATCCLMWLFVPGEVWTRKLERLSVSRALGAMTHAARVLPSARPGEGFSVRQSVLAHRGDLARFIGKNFRQDPKNPKLLVNVIGHEDSKLPRVNFRLAPV